jgi:hypothetical protein
LFVAHLPDPQRVQVDDVLGVRRVGLLDLVEAAFAGVAGLAFATRGLTAPPPPAAAMRRSQVLRMSLKPRYFPSHSIRCVSVLGMRPPGAWSALRRRRPAAAIDAGSFIAFLSALVNRACAEMQR